MSKKHLHRYLCEFELCYNQREAADAERTAAAIRDRREAPHRRAGEGRVMSNDGDGEWPPPRFAPALWAVVAVGLLGLTAWAVWLVLRP